MTAGHNYFVILEAGNKSNLNEILRDFTDTYFEIRTLG